MQPTMATIPLHQPLHHEFQNFKYIDSGLLSATHWIQKNHVLLQSIAKHPKRGLLRMYCIDIPRVPESSDAGTFHCLYE